MTTPPLGIGARQFVRPFVGLRRKDREVVVVAYEFRRQGCSCLQEECGSRRQYVREEVSDATEKLFERSKTQCLPLSNNGTIVHDVYSQVMRRIDRF